MLRPRLFISRDIDLDYLSAIEFGSVDDGQTDDAWRVVGERVGFLLEGGRCIGFRVTGFDSFGPEAEGFEALWADPPRFDVPQLGLRDEARHALETATGLEEDGGDETDAPELLEELEGRNARRG